MKSKSDYLHHMATTSDFRIGDVLCVGIYLIPRPLLLQQHIMEPICLAKLATADKMQINFLLPCRVCD